MGEGMGFPNTRQVKWIVKPIWFSACLAPFVWLCLAAFELIGNGLGADPIEATQDFVGIWALRCLLLTLALTPLRKITGKTWLIQLRRMTGLFALFYACMHLLNYLIPDQGLDWAAIIEDVLDRPFITLGAAALTGLIILGVTSTNGWRRRLGKRWQRLHKLVYVIGILVCWHFWWQVKQDILEPAIYAAILSALLLFRLVDARKKKAARTG
jgi:sulfoxide reductase heme-binding subunit YedZ